PGNGQSAGQQPPPAGSANAPSPSEPADQQTQESIEALLRAAEAGLAQAAQEELKQAASDEGGTDDVPPQPATQASDSAAAVTTDAAGAQSATQANAADASTSPLPFELDDLAAAAASDSDNAAASDDGMMGLLADVDLDLRIELGRTQMRLEDVLHLRSGAVVTLDKLAGDPVDVLVNGKMIARGEVLVMNDNFCIRVTELISQ
ncbi:MAG: flagellar motor switch protein FliN, partial [Planctomycetota bacterium]